VVPVLEAPPPAPQPPAPPCQPPSMGQPIILAGCRKGDTIALRGVNFEFNSAKLTVNARALLDQVAAALQARKDIDVEIDGHTDGKGSDPYNQKLSQERAASVRQYLADRGVDAGRMSTKGFGKSMPVADNSTDEGRELNRRVELKVTAASAPVGETGGTAPR
jgi:OOP family OmpA-OmpF porin